MGKVLCATCNIDNGETLVAVNGIFYHKHHRPQPVLSVEQRRQRMLRPSGLREIKIKAVAQSHYREGAD